MGVVTGVEEGVGGSTFVVGFGFVVSSDTTSFSTEVLDGGVEALVAVLGVGRGSVAGQGPLGVVGGGELGEIESPFGIDSSESLGPSCFSASWETPGDPSFETPDVSAAVEGVASF
jgi:hypothetical protein